MRRLAMAWRGAALFLVATPARAIEVEDVGGETLTIDVSNTAEVGFHFDNRNDVPGSATNRVLTPADRVDDHYVEWLNRLYLRVFYWKLSLGVRVDSALFVDALDREEAQSLIVEELGAPDLDLENRFGRELHSRFASHVYPSKLWLAFKHEGFEATLGDYYLQVGRGLVFSVRKIDEVGIDTTVRGGKLQYSGKHGGVLLDATLFGGQLNPIRLDVATGRLLHGSGSPLFFAFPRAGDFSYYESDAPDAPLRTERARPSYLEDNVVGASFTLGPKEVQAGVHGALLLRQGNSEDQLRCIAAGSPATDCVVDFPSFTSPDASRSHDQIRNVSASLRVPPIAKLVDGYVEAAWQHQTDGRVSAIGPDGALVRDPDLYGYALYGNVALNAGPVSATLEGKHYRSFFPLAANVDLTTPGFGAPEFSVVTYSRPPTAEAVYVQQIGAPDICTTGGRARVDGRLSERLRVYAWLGRSRSWSEIDSTNRECSTARELQTDTWDTAAGTEIDAAGGKSHYWGWLGARFTDRAEDAPGNVARPDPTSVFYREGYVRYDLQQHLAGDFSLSALGHHRRRYEPIALADFWHEGENLLALNWSPHFSFIFGIEYQTRPGLPETYFNGGVLYRAAGGDAWYDKILDTVRLFVGQRRAAFRCVAGVCRLFPAFEGAKIELVSKF